MIEILPVLVGIAVCRAGNVGIKDTITLAWLRAITSRSTEGATAAKIVLVVAPDTERIVVAIGGWLQIRITTILAQ